MSTASSSELDQVLNDEKTRLLNKKEEIDAAINSQKRMINFNNSYNERYIYYLKIMIVIVLTLVLFFGLRYIGDEVEYIPDWIIDLVTIIIIGVAFFVIYYTTIDILNRDNMDFRELKLPAPITLSEKESAALRDAAGQRGDLIGTIDNSTCRGSQCCGRDTLWFPDNQLCHKPDWVDLSRIATTPPTPTMRR
jgi:hypothetical protein